MGGKVTSVVTRPVLFSNRHSLSLAGGVGPAKLNRDAPIAPGALPLVKGVYLAAQAHCCRFLTAVLTEAQLCLRI